MKKNYLQVFFSWIADTINGAERAILDFLGSFVPYTTASIPAYLTYVHTFTEMAFPREVAFLAAFTVEVLGVTSVSTAIRFFQWNKNHRGETAPFWLAFSTYVFYIVITLSVNVLLEVHSGVRAPAVIWSIGLFSLLSIPSGVLISVRAQFAEMLEDKREKAEEKKNERMAARGLKPGGKPLGFSPSAVEEKSGNYQMSFLEDGKSNKRSKQRRE